jgi:hypothetical protein
MPLLRQRHTRESDARVKAARFQVDLAVLKMTEMLDKVEQQAAQAKEELDERKSD